MRPACCSILATTVTVVRRTPSICDDGARVRPAHSKSGEGAHRSFVTDRRGLYGVALPYNGQERHDPVMGEIDLVDALALLLQDRALLEDDVLELGGKQCEVFRGERSQKQTAPARARAIQFHPQPFSSSQPHQRTALRRRARPAGGIGKPPARALSVRYPTKMLRNEGLR